MPDRIDTTAAVSHLRLFNRVYTRMVGVLADAHLGTGLPLGQARVLFEIGQLGSIDMVALRRFLDLDAGYLSRMLASLEKSQLIRTRASREDRRVRSVTVTPKGRAKLALLDRRSDDLVERRIERLGEGERQRLVACATEIRRLLGDPVEIHPRPPTSPEARACLAGYFAELDRRFPEGFDPTRSISADPGETRPPAGDFLVVSCGGLPRGCGAVKTLEPGVGEIKRMWLHPELRGRGVGRLLLEALEQRSRELGFRVLRLDTSSHLGEAIALYRSSGYVEVAPYNDNRYAALWFEKELAPDPSRRRLRTARGRAVSSVLREGGPGGSGSRRGS